MLSCFSHVWLFMTLCTIAHQAPQSMGILQARILEWVGMPFSTGSSWPSDQTHVLLHCRLILYPLSHEGGPNIYVFNLKLKKKPPKPKNHHVTLPPYNLQAGTLRRHSVFRLWLFALPASATDPLPGLCNSNLTAWFRTRLWIYVTPPSPLVPHAWPDLLNQCPHPIHSINKTQQNHIYVCKLRSLNHW